MVEMWRAVCFIHSHKTCHPIIPSHNSHNQIMCTYLEQARIKIAGNSDTSVPPSFPFDELPLRDDSPLWNEIRTTYNLSLVQLSALKNARCGQPQAGRKY